MNTTRSLPNPALAADFLAAVREWLEERDRQRPLLRYSTPALETAVMFGYTSLETYVDGELVYLPVTREQLLDELKYRGVTL